MVIRRLLRGILFAPWLAACELVIGGQSQATLRPQDGAVEAAGSSDAAPPDSNAASADAAVSDDPPRAPLAEAAPPGGPCAAPPSCLADEQACASDCSQQDPCATGDGALQKNKCGHGSDDCVAACQSTCITCSGCLLAAGCMLP